MQNAEHHTLFVTGFVDLASGRLLDVVENRCGASVSGWLAAMCTEWRDSIKVLALDPHGGYYRGLTAAFADRAERGARSVPTPEGGSAHYLSTST